MGLAQHAGARGIGESHNIEGQILEVNDSVSMPSQSGNGGLKLMNKQYSGQSWRLLQLAVKHALYDHSLSMLAFNEGLAHNLGVAWRRFFKIADRVQARGPGFEGCPVNAKPISNQGHGHSCHL